MIHPMPTPPSDPQEVVISVSHALRRFICACVPLLAADSSVTFESPAQIDQSNANLLSLCLYQLELNPAMRNAPSTLSAEWSDPRSLASLVETPAPLAVDLLYLVVIYGVSPDFEQMIASSVAGLLDRCGRIPSNFISQSLIDSGNSVLNVIPQPATIHMLRDLWAGFPNKAYHLTKLYMVSPVRLPAPGEFVDVVLQVDVHEPRVTNPKEVSA